MIYREPLPEGCPPENSMEIVESLTVFRMVRSASPTSEDFRSQRGEQPGRTFSGVSECQARGLSVFADRRDAENALKLPRLRGRHICGIKLAEGAGRILQTGRPSHHTWWPLADFEILSYCETEAA